MRDIVLEEEHGFSVLEVLVAMVVLVVVGLAGFSAGTLALRLARDGRDRAVALSAAAARLEQLRALDWRWGEGSAPSAVSDVSTMLASEHPAGGGTGLSVTGESALVGDQPGLSDALDAEGRWLAEPTRASFRRRWAVTAPPSAPDARVITVRVSAGAAASGRDVWFVVVKARTTS